MSNLVAPCLSKSWNEVSVSVRGLVKTSFPGEPEPVPA